MTVQVLIAGSVSLVLFILLDAAWITVVALPMFRTALGDALLFRPVPAVLFYVVHIVGILGLVVAPTLSQRDWTGALWRGALLGICAYGTYDLTNLATLKVWSVRMAALDIAWGVTATALVSTIAVLVAGNRS
jgi:uncharacterized membrane protein